MALNWGSVNKEKGWDGLNNAAINSFNSNIINSFVREMFQNSNDARINGDNGSASKRPLEISIDYRTVSEDAIPEFSRFRKILDQIAHDHPVHKYFFENAKKAIANPKKIPLFIYEDFNTTGLSGADDDVNSSFNSCVLSEGTSVKEKEDSGGSFGIGKNAIFGFSKLRTVFYSSLNSKNEFIFQGLSKLACWKDEKGINKESRVYLGEGIHFSSIRSLSELPEKAQKLFKRDRPGLSQFALGPVQEPNWVETFGKAILRNYWLLLSQGELTVKLKNEGTLQETISVKTLDSLMGKYFDPHNYRKRDDVKPEGNPFEYYHAFKNAKKVVKNIPALGKVELYIEEIQTNRTSRIAYLRNSMVVFSDSQWGFGSLKYAGVFQCVSSKGNQILKNMEPPTHDSFDPERLTEKSDQLSVNEGRKILEQIGDVIKEELKKIKDKYSKPVESIPWLDDLLSNISKKGAAKGPKRTNEEASMETTQRIGKLFNKNLSFYSLSNNTLVDDSEGDTIGFGGKKGENGGQISEGDTEQERGEINGDTSGGLKVPKRKIVTRIFKTNTPIPSNSNANNSYKLILSSSKPSNSVNVILSQHGDSGKSALFELKMITDELGNKIEFSPKENRKGEKVGYRLENLCIPGKYEIFLSEHYKSSFIIKEE